MSHQGSDGAQGKPTEIKAYLELSETYDNLINDYIAKRSGMTRKAYEDLIVNDIWMESAKATAMKFNDKIVILRSAVPLFAPMQPKPKNDLISIFGGETPPAKPNPQPYDRQFILDKKWEMR
jgi:hypothetical protein